MKTCMTIEDLLRKVVSQKEAKRDLVANTRDAVRMVDVSGSDKPHLVLLREGAEQLERFTISEHAHRQIAGRLNVPWRYYDRLLRDHRDLVYANVNALFEREPESRLIRTLDGEVRAFLSDRYGFVEHEDVLEKTLPRLIGGEIACVPLRSYVSPASMDLTILFTADELSIDLGSMEGRQSAWGNVDLDQDHQVIARRDVGRDVVRPGIRITNNEVGAGKAGIQGFLFRSYCLNGLVWGKRDAFSFSRTHRGARLESGDDFVLFSPETQALQKETLAAEFNDALSALVDPANVRRMAEALQRAKASVPVRNGHAAVGHLAKEVDLSESEQEGVLENLLLGGDLSQWGMVNAVTQLANEASVKHERVLELEELGGRIINLPAGEWSRIAHAEKHAA